MHKRLCELNAMEFGTKEILTTMVASLFHRILQYQIFFAIINHQYVDTYRTKKQTENMVSSCSIISSKTVSIHIAVHFSDLS